MKYAVSKLIPRMSGQVIHEYDDGHILVHVYGLHPVLGHKDYWIVREEEEKE